MICLIHWCCQGNHLCSLAERTKNDKISFLKVVLFFRGCPFVTSSHSVSTVSLFLLCLCVSLPLPPLPFSSFLHTHTPTPGMLESVEVLIRAIGDPDLFYSQHWSVHICTNHSRAEDLLCGDEAWIFRKRISCSLWIFASSDGGKLLKTAVCWCIWGI